ncbi:PTS lactose/cellobiose transporter subunit IIA [Caloramator proteoclasticus]|uniref:PTS system, cellobiose-specific IIA component n=1 Tax=Caloramator proteoclasticus DSM 10124 TaxID=1121262 RepID=A0A1M4T2R5_9CLOT|nr:PTS lactose/cellobiose transporter subunit IIA [Caloramator proteoclasticus]SHE38741.1 PTS system, cellobiose-specific IIA component [Caloramator proteoclasticus DSM 10124]
MENEIFEIISHGGNARAYAFEAVKKAQEGNIKEAEELLAKAQEELDIAHNTQTKLIQAEINGENLQMNLLMVHAQDHLMTAISEKNLIEQIVNLCKKLEEKK